MKKPIRIGTRDSALALWQAEQVLNKLIEQGLQAQLVPIKSEGDIVLNKPLYEMGITGVFTKTLDVALLENKIDLAVHSMKDVPTVLPQGIVQVAVLERANTSDVLVCNQPFDFAPEKAIIATGSLRRKAQWLHRFKNHQIEGLRGNVFSRLDKLKNSDWNGAIFAQAGLGRLGLNLEFSYPLDWMIPAPAQGAMVVVARGEDFQLQEALSVLNHIETEITTYIERQFLRTLEGGCSAPIGAQVVYNEAKDNLLFKGVLLSLDGKQKLEIVREVPLNQWKKLGFHLAQELLSSGGEKLMQQIKSQL